MVDAREIGRDLCLLIEKADGNFVELGRTVTRQLLPPFRPTVEPDNRAQRKAREARDRKLPGDK